MLPTHSKILATLSHLHAGKALDAGCDSGWNSLLLNQPSFDVEAWDINRDTIQNLNNIIQAKKSAAFIYSFVIWIKILTSMTDMISFAVQS
jgi:Tellurite resistance protein TehB